MTAPRWATAMTVALSMVMTADHALATTAQGADAADDRTWLGWLSGFAAVLLVLGACLGAVTVLRRRRERRHSPPRARFRRR